MAGRRGESWADMGLDQDDVLVKVSRRQLQILAQYKQPVQTNQIAFSNSGNELFLTTGDSQVKILDYPTMVCSLPPKFSDNSNVRPHHYQANIFHSQQYTP